MADHQADSQDDQEPTGTLLEGQNSDASSDDKAALVAELVKKRQEAAALKAELEQERLAKSEKTKSVPPQAPDSEKLLERLTAIEKRDRLRDLMSEHDLNPRQADAVSDLMQKMPELSPDEAKTLAAHRDKELFSDTSNASGFDPSIHGSSRPTSGFIPDAQEESDFEDRKAHIAQLRRSGSKKEAQKLIDNLVGTIAARQVRKPGHKLIPIPRKQQ